MSIFAIGDLHLSFQTNKPMDIFGMQWENYITKLENNWINNISKDDLIILMGDFSWAMNLEETLLDFKFIDKLPGTKILIKGNHDYWWTTISKMNNFLNKNNIKNVFFLQNNSYNYNNYSIVGTRGWSFTESENSNKMINRELSRLKNSILSIKNIESKKIICVMHYPPITKEMQKNNQKSPYLELLKKYQINNCYYGHLHGKAHNDAVEGIIDGIKLELLSSDYINFNPKKITE